MLFFGPFIVNAICSKTNIFPEIKRWTPKMSSNILHYQKMAQKSVRFGIMCNFYQYSSIPMARFAIFRKYNIFKDTYRGFLGLIFWFMERYLCLNMLYYHERTQKLVRFWILCSFGSFCSILKAIYCIFFGNITCLRTLIGHFQVWSLDFWKNINNFLKWKSN